MRYHSRKSVLSVWVPLLMLLLIAQGRAEEPTWGAYFDSLAGAYRMEEADGKSKTELQLVPNPVAKWSQPIRGGDDGSIYLWLSHGRPAAAAAIFCWPHGDVLGISHERVSLSELPIEASLKEIHWLAPPKAIRWTKLEPTNNSAANNLQIRAIARRFQATSRNKEASPQQLRLIERPIFEYQLKEDKVVGSLFRFVEGTDTEILLMIENRMAEPAVYYSLARLSDLELQVTLDDRSVWRVPPAQFDQANAHYYCAAHEYLKAPPSLPK